MRSNIDAIARVAVDRDIDMRIFFAHKASKCYHYVEAAAHAQIGIDVSSERELAAAISAGFEGSDIVVTSAAPAPPLIHAAIDIGATIILNGHDEYEAVLSETRNRMKTANVGIRLRGFDFSSGPHESRFGFDIDESFDFLRIDSPIRVTGLHFHLDGNSIADRVAAIRQTVLLANSFRAAGHPIEFIDIGGGFPVQYLVCEHQWSAFHDRVDQQLLDHEADPVIAKGHHFGRSFDGTDFQQTQRNHPTWQADDAGTWLGKILDSDGVRELIRESGLCLHCEPGRALVDGCGMTIARVENRKTDVRGDWLIGLGMNQTNCKTTSADFSVDPMLLTVGTGDRTLPGRGFFVGSYCAEDDWITPRRMQFNDGVALGDLVVFPNTAGYQMHFMESRAHQSELPANVVHS